MPVRLTDDEIVALAAHCGGPWPLALRTVDASSPQTVAQAMARGIRSLVVRELAVPGAQAGVSYSDEVVAPFVAVLRARRRIELRVGGGDVGLGSAEPVVSFHGPADDGSWTAVTGSPLGIEEVTTVTVEEARRLLVGEVGAVYRGGFGPRDGAAILYVLVTSPEVTSALVLTRGSVRVAAVDGSGSAAMVVGPGTSLEWSDDLVAGLVSAG